MFHVTSDRATICARCPGIVSFTELKHACFYSISELPRADRETSVRAGARDRDLSIAVGEMDLRTLILFAGRETTSGGRRRGMWRGSGAHSNSSVVPAGGKRFVAKDWSRHRTAMRTSVTVSVPARRPSESPRCFLPIMCLHTTDTNPTLN